MPSDSDLPAVDSLTQSAPIPVLTQPAVSQNTQCSSRSQSSSPIPIIAEQLSSVGIESATPDIHVSPAHNTKDDNVGFLATLMSDGPALVGSDQQATTEVLERSDDL
ncbi:hypothetical protein V6N12_021019 [Hibiscus sabdariffa]|uniref:Uncharacterized protein n=1 Tax=Hibiscus sabdariffa TaxID=183260 RepID=A0ABR2B239_9ROSI